METKLDYGQKHILKLIARDSGEDGWTPVGKMLFPHIRKEIPSELAEFEATDDAGRARLTEKGRSLVDAMAWL